MRTKKVALSTVAALVLGAGGLFAAAAPASAGPSQPGDCDSYYYNNTSPGYATIYCDAPSYSAYFLGHVVCQPHGTVALNLRYTVSATFPILVTATIRCQGQDTAVGADAVQA